MLNLILPLISKHKYLVAIIGAAALLFAIWLGYRHYTNMIETINVLRADNAQLTTAVDLQDETIKAQQGVIGDWKDSHQELVGRMDQLYTLADKAATETRRLNDIFSKHDLGRLAARKPGLIERSINNGTADVLRMLECASGTQSDDCPTDGGTPTRKASAAQP